MIATESRSCEGWFQSHTPAGIRFGTTPGAASLDVPPLLTQEGKSSPWIQTIHYPTCFAVAGLWSDRTETPHFVLKQDEGKAG